MQAWNLALLRSLLFAGFMCNLKRLDLFLQYACTPGWCLQEFFLR